MNSNNFRWVILFTIAFVGMALPLFADVIENPPVCTLDGAFFCNLQDIFANVEKIKSAIPVRGEYEGHRNYQQKIPPYEKRIEEIYNNVYFISIKPKFSKYDQVNQSHYFDVTFPWSVKRKNDLEYKTTIRYFIRASRETVSSSVAGKLYNARLKIYFKVLPDKRLSILESELYYHKDKIYEWE